MGADDLDVLLVEDNPGDARLIEEMLGDVEELLQRVDVGGSNAVGSQLHHEQRLEAGLERLATTDVDVVLLDLGLPDSTGLETLAAVVETTEFVPIVVLTGLRDEGVGLEAIERGAQDYLVKGDVTGDLLVRSIHHAIERNRQERERVQRLQQLGAINRLNEISQDVTHAVITTETREDLERAVCERVVDGEDYPFAWIGEVDRSADRIVPRVAAGAGDGYLEATTVTVDDDPTGRGPAARAVRTREVQVVEDAATDPDFEPWREPAVERGFRSGAAVPIVHEDLLYGVLCVYAATPHAFSGPEIDVLSRLGDVIGHAITALERRDALVSDTVLELEFEVEGVAEDLVALATDRASTIAFEKLVRTDERVLAYGRTGGIDPAELDAVATRSDLVDDLRVLDAEDGDDEEYEVEVVTAFGGSLFDAVATRGGYVRAATVDDGGLHFVTRFPPGRDKRQLVELVEDNCPAATPHAQRTVEGRERTVADVPSGIADRLTPKQRTALETAYFAGYFDWPRTSSSEEVADRLDVTPATFTHHLRAAERRVFDGVFESDEPADEEHASDWTSIEADE